jgi:hypothetical protein
MSKLDKNDEIIRSFFGICLERHMLLQYCLPVFKIVPTMIVLVHVDGLDAISLSRNKAFNHQDNLKIQ